MAASTSPLGAMWLVAASSATWHIVSSEGGPRSDTAESPKLHECVAKVLAGGKVAASDVSAVVLVGCASEEQALGDCLSNGLAPPRVLHALQADVARGLARLVAAEHGDASAGGFASEPLPSALGVVALPSADVARAPTSTTRSILNGAPDVDILFERGNPLPDVVRRIYSRKACGDNACLLVLQRDCFGDWQQCQLHTAVLTDFRRNGAPAPMEVAEVAFEVDLNGTIAVFVQPLASASASAPVAATESRRWGWKNWLMALSMVAFSTYTSNKLPRALTLPHVEEIAHSTYSQEDLPDASDLAASSEL